MGDTMTFPKTVEEFMEEYKIVDSDQVYTNGAELVPIFRMKQWFEHINATSDAVPVVRCRECKHAKQTNDGYYACVWSAVLTGAGWFCCHGERKGGDE